MTAVILSHPGGVWRSLALSQRTRYNAPAMKQQFSDRASFLKAAGVLREATFFGRDLVHDKAAHTLVFTLTRADGSGGSGGFMGGRKTSYLKTVVTVKGITSYKQSLAGEIDDVFVFDRAEVGRAGQELAFYFRPGDRAVMDVEQITGSVEDAGKATSAPRRPVIVNPLVKEEREAAKPKGSVVGRLLGKSPKSGKSSK